MIKKLLLGSTFFSMSVMAADLAISLGGDSQTLTSQAANLQMSLTNTSRSTLRGVTSAVTLPQGFVINSISPANSLCAISGNQVSCNYGDLSRGASRSLNIAVRVPGAVGSYTVSATANVRRGTPVTSTHLVTVSAPQYSVVPTLPQNIHAMLCSGSGPLSWSDCVTYPSSQQHHDWILEAGSVVNTGPEGVGYTTNYIQPTTSKIQITSKDSNGVIEAVFNGDAVSNTCFEGVISYPSNTSWYGAFQLCLTP